MARPDFGTARDSVSIEGERAAVVELKFVAPGLTISDLVGIFDDAGTKVRGVAAVTDAILNAVYGP